MHFRQLLLFSACLAVLLIGAGERLGAGVACIGASASCPTSMLIVIAVDDDGHLKAGWHWRTPFTGSELRSQMLKLAGGPFGGYELGKDADAASYRNIQKLLLSLMRLRRQDSVILFLSGLAAKDGSGTVFVPTDATLEASGRLSNTISAADFEAWLAPVRAQVLLVVDVGAPANATGFPTAAAPLFSKLPYNIVAVQPVHGAGASNPSPGSLTETLLRAWSEAKDAAKNAPRAPGTSAGPISYADIESRIRQVSAGAALKTPAVVFLAEDSSRPVLRDPMTPRSFELASRLHDTYGQKTAAIMLTDADDRDLDRMLAPDYIDLAKRVLDSYSPLDTVAATLPRLERREVEALLTPIFKNAEPAGPICHVSAAAGAPPRALLIGIERFDQPPLTNLAGSGLRNLAGPANDVSLLRSALVGRGVPENRIMILAGTATRAQVINAFDALIGAATCGETVFVHLSGVGHQLSFAGPEYREFAPTRPEWAFGTSDAAVDSSTTAAGGWLRASELTAAVTALRNKGAFVSVSVDGCEAGSLDFSGRVRQVWRWQPFTRAVQPPPLLASASGFSAFYATTAEEKTLEVRLPEGRPDSKVYGLFTFALANAVADQKNSSTREIAEAITSYYKQSAARYDETHLQPMFEGTHPDQPLFGGAAAGGNLRIELLEPAPATRGLVSVKTPETRIAGRVVPATDVAGVAVNGKVIDVTPEGSFSVTLELSPGRNLVQIMSVTRDHRLGFHSFEVESSAGDPEVVRPSRSFALIIANQDYGKASGFGPLKTPVRDGQAIAQVLKERYGFKTELPLGDGSSLPLFLTNPTRTQLTRTLEITRQKLLEDDALLIYYAGHGWESSTGAVYWIPVDAEHNFFDTYIKADTITEQIAIMNTRHVLVVSDSCYAGGLMRGDTPAAVPPDAAKDGEGYKRYINALATKRSRVLIASGGNEPVLDGGGGEHSVFASALLNGLQQEGRDAFPAADLFGRYIKQSVLEIANQTPQYLPLPKLRHENGDFVFFRIGK